MTSYEIPVFNTLKQKEKVESGSGEIQRAACDFSALETYLKCIRQAYSGTAIRWIHQSISYVSGVFIPQLYIRKAYTSKYVALCCTAYPEKLSSV